MIEVLGEDEVMVIRQRLAASQLAGRDFGRTDPLSKDAFSSAVARQRAGYGEHLKYQTIADVAATFFYGLVLNHAFENGNKRTALVALLAFLERNKVMLVDTSQDDLYELSLAVASHCLQIKGDRTADKEVEAISRWLKARTRPRKLGDWNMEFKEFKKQLEDLGCEWSKPTGNFIKVSRATPGGSFTAKMGYPRNHFTVGVGDVKRVRRALRLDELHGIDSASFYNFEETVDAFVNQYRQVLDRLAET